MPIARIDALHLAAEYPTHNDSGISATFHPDGSLKRLALERGGELVYSLELDGRGNGKATEFQGSGGSPDWEVYADGHYESFDAWSDNSGPQPRDYETWVQRWITKIEDEGR